MKSITLLTVLSFSFFLSSCGSYQTGGASPEPSSYLFFSGSTSGAEVFIDEASGFMVMKTEEDNVNHYKVTPGKHLIVIKKGDIIIVKRNVMLTDGSTKEIHIPK